MSNICARLAMAGLEDLYFLIYSKGCAEYSIDKKELAVAFEQSVSGKVALCRAEAEDSGPSSSIMWAITLEKRARICECAGSTLPSSSFSSTSQLLAKPSGMPSRYVYSVPMAGMCLASRYVTSSMVYSCAFHIAVCHIPRGATKANLEDLPVSGSSEVVAGS